MMKKIFCLLTALVMLIALVSCGAASKNEAMDMVVKPGEMYSPEMDASGFDNYYSNYSKDEIQTEDVIVYEVYEGTPTEKPQEEFEQKLIVTVTLRTETLTFDKALNSLRAAVVGYGGYEESFNANGKSFGSSDTYCRNASLSVRIPAQRLEEFLGELGTMVNIVSENNSMKNATEEYYDLASRVKVLEEERTAYENMLAKATEVEDVLVIKDRLYNVISEIESAKTRMRVIDSRASYSTVNIFLQEVIVYSQIPTVQTTFGQRIGNTFKESWQNFGRGCQDFAVWFVGAIPTLLIISVIVAAVVLVAVAVYRKRKNSKKQ